MKAVILAGGLGTRISEETNKKPKPMIEIGGKPILWHIMKQLSNHGIKEFIICLGYLGYSIKEYFINLNRHNNDFKIDIKTGQVQNFSDKTDDWIINLVDTGQETMTGGRLKRVKNFLKNEDFLMTYGDGVSDINVTNLINFHKNNNKLATVTAVKPLGRFGSLNIGKNNEVNSFSEKPKGDIGWINGGFFIVNPKCIDLIDDDRTFWEREPINSLVSSNQLSAYKHEGFWFAVDTMRDKIYLENLIAREGKFPWLE